MFTFCRLTFVLVLLTTTIGFSAPVVASTAPFEINFGALPQTIGPGEVALAHAFISRDTTSCTACPTNPPPNATCCTGSITVSVVDLPPGIEGCVLDGNLCLPSLVTENPDLLLLAGDLVVPGVYQVGLQAEAQTGPEPRTQSDSVEVTVVPYSVVVSRSAELIAGGDATLALNLARNQGYEENVSLDVDTSNPLLSAAIELDPTTGDPTVLVLEAATALADGIYSAAVTATDGTITRTKEIEVTVKSAFRLSLSPGARDAVAGVPASFQISVVRDPEFTSRLAFSFTTGNPGITGNVGVVGGQLTLTLSVLPSVAPGNYPVQVTATGGGITKTTTGVLKVHRFLLQLGESFALLEPGGETFEIPITLVRGTGFTSAVNFSLTGLPSGASVGASFAPSSTTGNSSTLRLTAGRFAPEGDYTATVKATAGSVVESAVIGVEVLPNGLP